MREKDFGKAAKAVTVFAFIFSFVSALLLALLFLFGRDFGLFGAGGAGLPVCLGAALLLVVIPPIVGILAVYRTSKRVEWARRTLKSSRKEARYGGMLGLERDAAFKVRAYPEPEERDGFYGRD